MASKLYFRGASVGTASIDMMLNDMFYDETPTEEAFRNLSRSYHEYMHAALDTLDDRLWWQPETSEIFYEDDGSDRPLPFEEDDGDFETWWNETTERWMNSL